MRFSFSAASLATLWVGIFSVSGARAHAPLEPGDIFVVGLSTGPTPTVALMALVELHEGDAVLLTDRGWLASGGFRSGEGQVVHTSQPLIVAAGTVIQVALQPGSSGMAVDPTGDQIILLRGGITPSGAPTGPLLDVFHTGGPFQSDALSDASSALPPAMLEHSLALATGGPWGYVGPTSGTRAELRAAIRDPGNWMSGAAPPTRFEVIGLRGEPCGMDGECITGFCTDGVCCDTSCDRAGTERCAFCNWGVGVADTGTCRPLSAGATCRSARDLCDAAELCDGVSPTCPPDTVHPNTRLCRFGTGPCDPTDFCDGLSPACPPNARSPAGTVCRPGATACDAPETCDGLSPQCPTDALATVGAVCRPAESVCDVAEVCDGASPQCPADSVAEAGIPCRVAMSVCDQEERCDGLAPTCPPDLGGPAGVLCRPAASVQCDTPEFCDGSSTSCPPDLRTDDGTACTVTDTGICAGPAACSLGACAPNACDDGDFCTVDVCDMANGCAPESIPDCCHSDEDCVATGPCQATRCDESHRCTNTTIEGCGLPDGGTVGPGRLHGGSCAAAPGAERALWLQLLGSLSMLWGGRRSRACRKTAGGGPRAAARSRSQ